MPHGGEMPVHKPTANQCVGLCVQRRDCVAAQYRHSTQYCKVHTNIAALQFMTLAPGVDVYVVTRCNKAGKRQVASLA